MNKVGRCITLLLLIGQVCSTPVAAALEGSTVPISQDSEGALFDPSIKVVVAGEQVTGEMPAANNTQPLAVTTVESPTLFSASITPPTQQTSVTPVAQRLLLSEVRMRTCVQTATSCPDDKAGSFVEIYNPEMTPVTLAGWKLEYVVSGAGGVFGTVSTLAILNLTLDAQSYAVVGDTSVAPADTMRVAMTGSIGNKSQGYVRLVNTNGQTIDLLGWGATSIQAEGGAPALPPDTNNSIQRCEAAAGILIDSDSNKNDFKQYTQVTPGVGVACPAPEAPEVNNTCEGIVLSEIAANVATEQQFIELYNSTSRPIDVTGCQLQTNRSTTKTHVLENETLAPQQYRSVQMSDAQLTLTKTTSGIVYLLSSDGTVEVDVQAYANLASNTSWARFDNDAWRPTYILTPGKANIDQEFLPCDAGYERSSSTGRCNKIVSVTDPADCGTGKYRSEDTGRCRTIPEESVLAACKLGQYRSEETNRCRNLVTASASKPCRDDQYRSEETNRCRNIASAANVLTPCKEGQERSVETNRCRNVTKSVPAAAFAVEPVKDGARAFVGWWALGGVTLLAVGYAGWEWRREVMVVVQKSSSFFTRCK